MSNNNYYYTFVLTPEGEISSMNRTDVNQERDSITYVQVDSSGKKMIGIFIDESRGKPKFIHYINQYLSDLKV